MAKGTKIREEDITAFSDWYRMWYGHPQVGTDVRQAYKKWRELASKKPPTFTLQDMKKAFGDGRLFEAGELMLPNIEKNTVFDVWYADTFPQKIKTE